MSDDKEYTDLDSLLDIDVTDVNGDESSVDELINKLNDIDRQKLINSLLANPLGATGNFPDGKLNENDQGELALSIGIDREKNVIIMNFGTQVAWIGIPKQQAIEMGEGMIKRANELP